MGHANSIAMRLGLARVGLSFRGSKLGTKRVWKNRECQIDVSINDTLHRELIGIGIGGTCVLI